MNIKENSGQAVLTVIIIMLVGLTIALVIFLNSLSDVRTTGVEEQSERAFNAAEAGLEQALALTGYSIGQSLTYNIDTGLSATIDVAANNTFESFVKEGDSATINLTGAPAGTQIDINWTNEADSTEKPASCDPGNDITPAGLIVESWNSSGTVSRYAYHPYGCVDGTAAGFTATAGAGNVVNALNYLSKITYTIAVGDMFLRIKPLYRSASVTIVSSSGDLPIQQEEFTSKATVTGSGESRAIKVVRTVAQLPSIFDYVIFTNSTIKY